MATWSRTLSAVVMQRPHPEGGPSMVEIEKPAFDAAAFLANAGLGRRIVQLAPNDAFFVQGSPAGSVFYLQKGRAKVTVVTATGKEVTISFFSAGDFLGEEALAQWLDCVWLLPPPLPPASLSESVAQR